MKMFFQSVFRKSGTKKSADDQRVSTYCSLNFLSSDGFRLFDALHRIFQSYQYPGKFKNREFFKSLKN